mmetsp:Transcript_94127/g.262964  ORF Transcript_94127/g.262964 Transcript_94127/m.262964 type:complete len:253 (-) Transcript_94127:78-836(-)
MVSLMAFTAALPCSAQSSPTTCSCWGTSFTCSSAGRNSSTIWPVQPWRSLENGFGPRCSSDHSAMRALRLKSENMMVKPRFTASPARSMVGACALVAPLLRGKPWSLQPLQHSQFRVTPSAGTLWMSSRSSAQVDGAAGGFWSPFRRSWSLPTSQHSMLYVLIRSPGTVTGSTSRKFSSNDVPSEMLTTTPTSLACSPEPEANSRWGPSPGWLLDAWPKAFPGPRLSTGGDCTTVYCFCVAAWLKAFFSPRL